MHRHPQAIAFAQTEFCIERPKGYPPAISGAHHDLWSTGGPGSQHRPGRSIWQPDRLRVVGNRRSVIHDQRDPTVGANLQRLG
jgi:hypothetical protein